MRAPGSQGLGVLEQAFVALIVLARVARPTSRNIRTQERWVTQKFGNRAGGRLTDSSKCLRLPIQRMEHNHIYLIDVPRVSRELRSYCHSPLTPV